MNFLKGLLASIIRPIIQDEINNLKNFITENQRRLKAYEEIDKKVVLLIESAENASTTEEARAHLRKLKAFRDSTIIN